MWRVASILIIQSWRHSGRTTWSLSWDLLPWLNKVSFHTLGQVKFSGFFLHLSPLKTLVQIQPWALIVDWVFSFYPIVWVFPVWFNTIPTSGAVSCKTSGVWNPHGKTTARTNKSISCQAPIARKSVFVNLVMEVPLFLNLWFPI